jgi:hypothetical protein
MVNTIGSLLPSDSSITTFTYGSNSHFLKLLGIFYIYLGYKNSDRYVTIISKVALFQNYILFLPTLVLVVSITEFIYAKNNIPITQIMNMIKNINGGGYDKPLL